MKNIKLITLLSIVVFSTVHSSSLLPRALQRDSSISFEERIVEGVQVTNPSNGVAYTVDYKFEKLQVNDQTTFKSFSLKASYRDDKGAHEDNFKGENMPGTTKIVGYKATIDDFVSNPTNLFKETTELSSITSVQSNQQTSNQESGCVIS